MPSTESLGKLIQEQALQQYSIVKTKQSSAKKQKYRLLKVAEGVSGNEQERLVAQATAIDVPDVPSKTVFVQEFVQRGLATPEAIAVSKHDKTISSLRSAKTRAKKSHNLSLVEELQTRIEATQATQKSAYDACIQNMTNGNNPYYPDSPDVTLDGVDKEPTPVKTPGSGAVIHRPASGTKLIRRPATTPAAGTAIVDLAPFTPLPRALEEKGTPQQISDYQNRSILQGLVLRQNLDAVTRKEDAETRKMAESNTSEILRQLKSMDNAPAPAASSVNAPTTSASVASRKAAPAKEPPLNDFALDRWVINDQASFDSLASQWVEALQQCSDVDASKVMLLRFLGFLCITLRPPSNLNLVDLVNNCPACADLIEINHRMHQIWTFDDPDWVQLGGYYIQQFDKRVGRNVGLRTVVDGKVQCKMAEIVAKDLAAACGSYTVRYVDNDGKMKEKNTSVERLLPCKPIDKFMADFLVNRGGT